MNSRNWHRKNGSKDRGLVYKERKRPEDDEVLDRIALLDKMVANGR